MRKCLSSFIKANMCICHICPYNIASAYNVCSSIVKNVKIIKISVNISPGVAYCGGGWQRVRRYRTKASGSVGIGIRRSSPLSPPSMRNNQRFRSSSHRALKATVLSAVNVVRARCAMRGVRKTAEKSRLMMHERVPKRSDNGRRISLGNSKCGVKRQ